MKGLKLLLFLGLAGCFTAPLAFADDPMDGDTVTVVDDSTTPTDVVNRIALPDSASDTARERSSFGAGVANDAQDPNTQMGKGFGQQVSQDAQSRDLGDQVREDFQRNQRADPQGGGAGTHGRP